MVMSRVLAAEFRGDALIDRRNWLGHLRECSRCAAAARRYEPGLPCAAGVRLLRAVVLSMGRGECLPVELAKWIPG